MDSPRSFMLGRPEIRWRVRWFVRRFGGCSPGSACPYPGPERGGRDRGERECGEQERTFRQGAWTLVAFSVPFGLCRSEEHTSELQSRGHLVCRLLLEKKNILYELQNILRRPSQDS